MDSTLKAELDPLANLLNLIPTNAPPVQTEVQGGEGIGVGISGISKVSMGGNGSSKGDDDAKVIVKVITTQLHTSLPKISMIITLTTTTTKPITKGVVIGSVGGGSSSSKHLLLLKYCITRERVFLQSFQKKKTKQL